MMGAEGLTRRHQDCYPERNYLVHASKTLTALFTQERQDS